MTHDYDVIVVGGRVAGASTAMLLARCGHSVLLVDRATMPSDTVSTHAVMRTGVLQLYRWGVLDSVVDTGTPPIRDIVLGFGDERIGFQVKPDYGVDTLYAPRRYLLDSLLVEAAERAGAEFRSRTTVTGLLRDAEGRVEGLTVRSNRKTVDITSRFVVGADGHTSRIAGLVGAATQDSHRPTNAVHYAYYEGIDWEGFWFQFTPGVNAGIIPTDAGQCLVFAGRPTQLRHRFEDEPDREFERLLRVGGPDLAATVAGGQRVSGFRGTKGLPGFIRKPWGPGWALVGDAGYTKDPISAHGMSDALRDAELCARALDTALRTPERTVTALGRYETLRNELSRRIFEESRALAQFEWTASEASERMRAISDEVRAECEAIVSLPSWEALRPVLAGTPAS